MRNNKLFFIKAAAFLLPLLIAAGFVELRLRAAPSSYAFKRRLIDQVGSKARVLVFGTSHAYYDFNPEVFSMPGFNLANTSQSLVLDQQIFVRFLPNFTDLKIVVLNLSYFSFEYRLYGNNDDYREFLYRRHFNIPGDGGPASQFNIRDFSLLAAFSIDMIRDILFHGFGQNLAREVNRTGWFDSSHSSYATAPISEAAGKGRADYHTSTLKPELTEENIAAIGAIIALAKSRNIQVVLAQAPAFETYTRHLDPAAEVRFHNNIHRLQTMFGLAFYDYLRDPRFQMEDFYNNDHLNSSGASKFSKIFDQEVLWRTIK